MEEFVNIGVEANPDELQEDQHAIIQVQWPDWTPAPGNLETYLMRGTAFLGSEIADLIGVMGSIVFQEFGRSLLGVAPDDPAQAGVNSTWTMIDDAGYTVEAGTEVSVQKAGDELIGFFVVEDVVVPPGTLSSSPGEVSLRAILAGEDANGLTADPQLIDNLDHVEDVQIVGTTSGGADAEDEEEYRNRLARYLQLLSPAPIVPRDFEVLIRDHASVHRAIALDGWNPTLDTIDNERYVGGIAVDENGEDVSNAVKDELEAQIDGLREVNFIFEMGAPTYTPIFVTTAIRCFVGFDPVEVDAAVTSALQDYLSPANWGVPPYDAGDTNQVWVNTDRVRKYELSQVINTVTGVNYIESLTFGTATAPATDTDVVLTGRIPLTRPATTGTAISVTANAGP